MSKLVANEVYVDNICQCDIWIWICLKIEIIEKSAQEHVKVVLSAIVALQ